MDTKQKKRRAAAPARKARNSNVSPDRRRKTGRAGTPDREERKLRVQQRRKAKIKNPPRQQRVIRPPREEIPSIIYTAPKPMRRGLFAWKLVSMAAVVAAVFLGLSVFFRVDTITVAGADKYTPWMIREASGVATGDALLSISEARVASRIISGLPYIGEVKVSRKLPGTVEIQVIELQVTYSIEDENGGWWLISSGGRAIESVNLETALGYTRVEGLAIRTPNPGDQVQAIPGRIIDPGEGTAVEMDQSDADQQLNALITIMTALEHNRIIGQINLIDMTRITDIRLEYPQLLTVRLGDDRQLEYKVSYLAAALEKLEANQSGELDLSLEYTEKAVFTPAR